MLCTLWDPSMFKHIGIPTCTQHLSTRFVRMPDDDRLKRSKHIASYVIKIVVRGVY